MIKVSVIVAVYNVAPFLDKCMTSLKNQTLRDFEVILVDDGSTDKSGRICDAYAREDSRFKVFHRANEGVASARELGVEKASGEYLIHVDPDDWIEDDMLEELYGCAISDEALHDGLRHVVARTHLLGRWQWLSQSPRIICDTGHNVEGMRGVVAQLNNTPHKKLRMVLGLTGDKDIEGILALLPTEAVYYFTRSNVPRALRVEELVQRALPYELKGQSFETSAEALAAAKQDAETEDLIFVGGSTYLVGEIMALLGIEN